MSDDKITRENINDKDKEKKSIQQKLIVDNYQQKFDEEQFRDDYPTLHRELASVEEPKGLKFASNDIEEGNGVDDGDIFGEGAIVEEESTLTIEEIQRRRKDSDPLSDFEPGIIDFIRRAKIPEDAIEVVEYMKTKGEITDDQAKKFINQIENKGLESFGQHKSDGYYFHHASVEKMKRAMMKLKKNK